MRYVRAASLILAVLLPLASCSTGSGNGSPDETDEAGRQTARPEDQGGSGSSSTQAKRPQLGKYVYDIVGLGTTDVPQGTRLTENVSASSDVYTVEVTNNRNSNTQRLQLRWEADRVVQLSNETNIRGDRRTCLYQPPRVLLRLPISKGRFDEQRWSDPQCERAIQVSVLERESVRDVTGRRWAAWVIQIRSESQGRADDQIRWFAPELGRDVRIETMTETENAQNHTAQTLRSHPAPV